MELTKKHTFIGLLLATVLVAVWWFTNNAKKLSATLDYSVMKIKVVKMGLFNTDLRASILIKNPSALGVVVKSSFVEVFFIDPTTKERKLVVKSTPSTMTVKANQNVINDVDFSISNFEGLSTLLNLLKQNSSNTNDNALKGRFAIVIHGEILGNFFTKEVIY